jgi:hypothetical protein
VKKHGTKTAYLVLDGQNKRIQFNLLDPVNAPDEIIQAIPTRSSASLPARRSDLTWIG